MNVRDTLGNHGNLAIAVSAFAIVISVGYIFRSKGGPSQGSFKMPTKAYFTTDDGKTLFADDAHKRPPFDHDGSIAVRAKVFTSDGGRHQWVQYLEKYADPAQPAAMAPAPGQPGPATSQLLVKRPDDAEWTPLTDVGRVQQICIPKKPEGTAGGEIHVSNPE